MNNHELDQLLKSAQTPARTEGYWRAFPGKVTSKLHWQTVSSACEMRSPKRGWAWAVGLATVCAAFGFFWAIEMQQKYLASFQAKDGDLAEARKCYQELEALFPNQLRAIVFDQQGPHLELASEADVPAAAPLYVKICGPKGCEGVVTFSGQQIQLNGEDCEVLANASGQVILVGSHQVWTSTHPAAGIQVEGRML